MAQRADGKGEDAVPSRREQRKSETRERLLLSARQLFVSKGFDETSYDEIARSAGVARQTAFNHFPRKEDFVAAWVAQRRIELHEAMGAAGEAGGAGESSASSRLLVVMRVMADIYERRREEGRVFMHAWVRLGGPILDEPVAAHMFAAVIRSGQQAGEFVADVDAEAAGEVIRAIYFDALWRWADPAYEPAANTLFENLLTRMQLVLTGLCTDGDRRHVRQAVNLVRSLEVVRGQESVS
ncbi:TetR/AcrR family transcriptional regulator [Amycolatopsis rhizosphaerae]|uniref:TetR/AcrR family transcriptional regulator n=1 Tax=Amycolatopsis rhizosphaerae TaxID=2053003 RepID=UPI001643B462|nr:TetR/AcrR family transcriptional regulator [Amycolatopsis rhizosphaerae]